MLVQQPGRDLERGVTGRIGFGPDHQSVGPAEIPIRRRRGLGVLGERPKLERVARDEDLRRGECDIRRGEIRDDDLPIVAVERDLPHLESTCASCTRPGGTSKLNDVPFVSVVVDPPFVAASFFAGTCPRKYTWPSVDAAITETAVTSSRRMPGVGGSGSHTNVSFVLPSAPREWPIQVRTKRPRVGSEIDDSALLTAGGGPGFGGAVTRAVSVAVSAQ